MFVITITADAKEPPAAHSSGLPGGGGVNVRINQDCDVTVTHRTHAALGLRAKDMAQTKANHPLSA
jgi:hypothetical protein